jgi:hypothetical protein
MAVDKAIKKNLFVNDRQPVLNGIQIINREVIIHFLRQLLEVDMQLAPFTIIGLEKDVIVPMSTGQFDTTIGGRIDRIDKITGAKGERIRVIDYKTGSRELKPLAGVEEIFAPQNNKSHNDYYLQTFIYANIIRNKTETPVSPALLFIQQAGSEEYDPTLCFGKTRIYDVAESRESFMQLLQQKINEIFDPSNPFTPTDDERKCQYCPYITLCRHYSTDN